MKREQEGLRFPLDLPRDGRNEVQFSDRRLRFCQLLGVKEIILIVRVLIDLLKLLVSFSLRDHFCYSGLCETLSFFLFDQQLLGVTYLLRLS